MTRSLSPPIEEKRNTNRQSKRAFCFCLVVLIYFKEEETAKAISNSSFPLKMLRKKKRFTRKFCETLTCKYRKSSKNNKFNKVLDLEREKAKKGLEKSANFAKIAKVTFLLLLQ